jgi:phosphopantothenoylcysteine decarboxylase/phosphopantothenate--cysteine ligase
VPSLTVRQLDDKIKQRLRLRAARNGRSVEDEVRTILRSAAAGDEAFAAAAAPDERVHRKSERKSEPTTRRVLLIIGGGIAAYKSLDLIRRLRERRVAVRAIMTPAAQRFITPLSVGAIAGEPPFTELFDLQSEFDVGHIRLARDTELVLVAPATADLIAKMAGGHADDLASAVLLATDRQILLAPAMNPRMWANKATLRNMAQLAADGVASVGPNTGEMAEQGEFGAGRMAEPLEIVAAAEALLPGADRSGALHRQPLVRQTGPCHCGCRSSRWRRGDSGVRPGTGARSARRPPGPGRDCARHAGRGRGGAAG